MLSGALLFAAILFPAHAAGTASLLDEGIGARAMAMGGTGAASARGALGMAWNPARLATLKKEQKDVAAAHAQVSPDTKVEWLGYAQQTEDGWGGAAVRYRDRPGAPAGDVETSDFALEAGFAKDDGEGQAGLSAKYLRSRASGAAADSFAGDLGIMRGEDGQGAAVVLRNAGPGLRFGSVKKDLPLTAALGFSKDAGKWNAAFDYEYRPLSGAHDVGMGFEYELLAGLWGRGGWTTKDEKAPGLVVARGFSVGGGLHWHGLRFDYGYRPRAGQWHRFDVSYLF